MYFVVGVVFLVLLLALIAGVAVGSAGFLIFVLGMMIKSRRRAVVSGREQMIGARGEALDDFEREGWARVQGETWRVKSAAPVKAGERLSVTGLEGLILQVEPIKTK